MSASESRNGREVDSIPEGGILAALPRARPQRASARRAAARSGAATRTKSTRANAATKPVRAAAATRAGAGKESPSDKQPATARKPVTGAKPARKPIGTKKPAAIKKPAATKKPADAKKSGNAKRRIAKPTEPPVPKQGYEPEEEVELGATVHPPSGAELVESVADIVGELAGSSLAAGGRLLKDAFSLLHRP